MPIILDNSIDYSSITYSKYFLYSNSILNSEPVASAYLNDDNYYVDYRPIYNRSTGYGSYAEFRYVNDVVYTPNGTAITVAKYIDDFPNWFIQQEDSWYSGTYSLADFLSPSTIFYNCHSYAWYNQNEDTNNAWMNYPYSYYEDLSYEEVYYNDLRIGDIICYYNTFGDNLHSGIISNVYSGISNNICGDSNLVEVKSKWGALGLYEHRGDQCPYTSYSVSYTDASAVEKDYYFASEVRYFRPKTNASYSLNNYSSQVNEIATICLSNNNTDNYEMYELNVSYTKYYEFYIYSNNALDVRLYDEHMQLMNICDLNNNSNYIHFINQLLDTKTYYLRVSYSSEESIGTINTQITSRNTVYLTSGENNILINSYNGVHDYVYTNNQGPGFYKFKLNATKPEGTNITYPSNSLVLYNDSTKTDEMGNYYRDEDELLVYLPSNGAYYLDINLYGDIYSSFNIEIDSVERKTIDYINGLTNVSFNILFENINSLYHYEEITIKQRSEIQLDITTSGIMTDSIPVYIYTIVYNEVTKVYNLVPVLMNEISLTNRSPVFTMVLDAGTYIFGYAENDNNVSINFALRRMVNYNISSEGVLVVDPNQTDYHLGTEVLFNNGACDNYTITEGFTRNIYLMVEDRLRDPISRLDYDWYSSNEFVATVTNYGTVLAMPVEEDTEVTIYAVLKDDPKVVYYRTFTVLNDEEDELIEIELNMSYSYDEENGTYQLELTNTNCPYPMIQYYSWNIVNNSDETVTMNYWGEVTSTGICEVLIIGTYNLNSRVKLYITLSIE